MKRLYAIALLVVFCLPMLYPLAVLADENAQDAKLPACCRRHGGMHDCPMMRAYLISLTPGTKLLATPVPCPSCPCTAPSGVHFDLGIGKAGTLLAQLFSQPSPCAQTEARARIALDRAWRKRGPPVVVLS
jgi:hypothetical protein